MKCVLDASCKKVENSNFIKDWKKLLIISLKNPFLLQFANLELSDRHKSNAAVN